tara:strand:- start:5469 stop:6206 length:738 start_codon:yes stop_codon:yes gene_type:complete
VADDKQHRNDIYGDIDKAPEEASPAIPAATVILLKDTDSGIQTLMLHRTSKVHFGGMWVFPGGRIDPEDYGNNPEDVDRAALQAAARETMEEANLSIAPDQFVYFAHWTPPASVPKRYATWFFAMSVDGEHDVTVDGEEIAEHEWISPANALARHGKGEIDLAPPTWITLHHVSRYETAAEVLKVFADNPHRVYETHIGKRADGVRVAMWDGDAGYEATDADAEGPRHRLVMAEGGFEFETDISY